jgi:hypothetical protein
MKRRINLRGVKTFLLLLVYLFPRMVPENCCLRSVSEAYKTTPV